MARIAPLPVVLNRRLNEEYPFAGPPASDGGFPYARTCATGVPVPVPGPPTRVAVCGWREGEADDRTKIEANDDDEAKDDDARRLRPINRDNNDDDDVDDIQDTERRTLKLSKPRPIRFERGAEEAWARTRHSSSSQALVFFSLSKLQSRWVRSLFLCTACRRLAGPGVIPAPFLSGSRNTVLPGNMAVVAYSLRS